MTWKSMETVRQQLVVEDKSDVHGFFLACVDHQLTKIRRWDRCLGSAIRHVRLTPDIVSNTLSTAATSRSPRSIALAAS